MFFSVGALGNLSFNNKVVVPNRAFDKVSLLGNATFDGVHLRKNVLSDQEFLDIETEEHFGVNSIFVANFNDNLEAGSFSSFSAAISKWRIRRKKVGNFSPTFLAEVDVAQTNYTDNTQANRTRYEYQISPVATDGAEGIPVTSITESDFFGWFLVSEDNQTVYKFDMNLESDSIALIMDTKLFEGFTKYPVTRTGKRKYHSGGLKTMPYSITSGGITGWYATPYSSSGELKIDNQLLREIEDFISNGQPKFLKNTSGDLFKVMTSDFSYQFMDTITEQPFTISFKFTQVGDGE